MDQKIDELLKRLERVFTSWLDNFEKNPIQTSLKVLLILWIVRWVKRNVL